MLYRRLDKWRDFKQFGNGGNLMKRGLDGWRDIKEEVRWTQRYQRGEEEVGGMEESQVVQRKVWIDGEMLSRLVDENGWMDGWISNILENRLNEWMDGWMWYIKWAGRGHLMVGKFLNRLEKGLDGWIGL